MPDSIPGPVRDGWCHPGDEREAAGAADHIWTCEEVAALLG